MREKEQKQVYIEHTEQEYSEMSSYNGYRQKRGEGGGGGVGTHILYVRYIILLQKGRQAEKRRKSQRKKDEGLRERQAVG